MSAVTVEQITRDDFMSNLVFSMMGLDDAFITEGLDEKTSSYLLKRAEQNPSIRTSLAKAAVIRQTRQPRVKQSARFAYFIQQVSGGPIKIGSATDPHARLATLQTGSPQPLRLLAAIDGGERKERAMHHQFSHLRIAGEWFRPAPELLALIKEVSA